MIFDDLCGFAERHKPDLAPLLKKARLFRIEESRSENVAADAQNWDEEEYMGMVQNMALPFDEVAIEVAPTRSSRGNCCVVLRRLPESHHQHLGFVIGRPSPEGLSVLTGSVRPFQEAESGDYIEAKGPADLASEKIAPTEGVEGYIATARSVRGLAMGVEAPPLSEKAQMVEKLARQMRVGEITMAEAHAIKLRDGLTRAHVDEVIKHEEWSLDAAYRSVLRIELAKACLYLLWISKPSRFVVEEALTTAIPKQKPGTILRSPWRSHFITLEPSDIRARYNLRRADEPTGKRAPHEKRGHWRCFRSERFSEAVRHHEVDRSVLGRPREAILGPNKYIVRLDV